MRCSGGCSLTGIMGCILSRRRSGALVLATSLVTFSLVVSTGGTAWAEVFDPPAAVESPAPQDSEELPPLESEQPEFVAPGEPSTGDFTDEPLDAPITVPDLAPNPDTAEMLSTDQFDPDEAELVSRSEFENVYLNEDGSKTSVTSIEPVNVIDDGEWVPIETEVSPVGPWAWMGIGDGAEVERHPLSPTFAQTASDTGVYTLTNDDHTIRFTLADASDAGLVRDAGEGDDAASHLEYRNVFPDTDLVYDITTAGVKENFRLKDKPGSEGRVEWSWLVDADGLSVRKDPDGNILFLANGAAEPVFVVPPSVMQDSAGVEGVRTPASASVRSTVLKQGARYKIVMTADREWLNDSSRVYPVLVDPTAIAINPDNIRSYKSNGNESYDVQIGNSNNGGIWRTVIHFPYSQFFGKQVLQVEVDVNAVYADSTSNDHVGRINVATGWGYNSLGEDLGTIAIGPNSSNYSAELALQTRVAQWIRDGQSAGTFTVRGDESATYSYQHLTLGMIVQYKEYPSPGSPGTSSPAVWSTHQSLTPKLSVQGATTDGPWQLQYYFRVSTSTDPRGDANAAYDSNWIYANEVTIPENRLQPNTQYYWVWWVRDATDGFLGFNNQRPSIHQGAFRTNDLPVTVRDSASPADKSIVTTLTPTLEVAPAVNPDNRSLWYWFRIATGPDARTGAVAQSGWKKGTGETTWTVPANYLADGATYTWTVLTKDDYTEGRTSWTGRFTVNLRITDPGPAPTDTAGPVTVNLANGNAGLQFTTPTVATAGGPLGFSFSYNSLQTKTPGLLGEYFNAKDEGASQPSFLFGTRTPIIQRQDSLIDFNWAAGSPTAATDGAPGIKPVVPSDGFLVRWTGYISLKPGTYHFGVNGDDGFRAWIDGTSIINSWQENSNATVWAASPYNVTTERAYPFKFEYYENGGDATIRFLKRPNSTVTSGPDIVPVPAEWFTRTSPLLPTGWGSSSILAGTSSNYTKAEVNEGTIKFTDTTGSVHTYIKKSAGGYEPPEGETGVVSLSTNGTVALTDGTGMVYSFAKDGKFASATTPTDVKRPTAPVVTYRSTGQVDTVSDPLSVVDANATNMTYDRKVKYYYQGDPECAPITGFGETPTGMLCRVAYPNGTWTDIRYDSFGNLIRIVNPGKDVVDFEYDSLRRLDGIRNALAFDWLAADSTRNKTVDTTKTTLTYDQTTGRVTSVKLPAADGVDASTQPIKTYTYKPSAGVSYVAVTGLAVASPGPSDGKALKVTYNELLQTTSRISAEGLTTRTEWNSKDKQLWTVDPQGLKSTILYNEQDRVTDTYGPAQDKASDGSEGLCFGGDRLPIASCPVVPAHTQTTYDEDLQGLDVQYFANENMAGKPAAFSLGIDGAASKAFVRDWGAANPIAGVGADNWSLRGQGLITFPETGRYRFNIFADDAVRLYIDDTLIVNNMTTHPGAFVSDDKYFPQAAGSAVQAGHTARIRIEYAEHEGDAVVRLYWGRPSMAATAREGVPGSALTPNYGLATRSTAYDSVPTGVAGVTSAQVADMVTSTSYGDAPWLGLQTATTVDPDGLALTSRTTYESSELYNRPLGTLSPADAGATITTNGTFNKYWDVSGTPGTAICGISATQKQYGMLKSTRSAPATNESGLADIVTEYVYDVMGRAVGTKKTGDEDWSCTTYDSRGRMATQTMKGLGTSARTITYAYTGADGNPLVSSVKDDRTVGSTTQGKITTVVDLLGRTTSSTDVWDTDTTIKYDRLGRVVSTTTAPAIGSPNTLTYAYSLDGRVEKINDNGKTIADPSYTVGQLSRVVYPAVSTTGAGNGTEQKPISRDPAGRDSEHNRKFSGDTGHVCDAVVRSQSGRIIRDVISDPHAAGDYASTYSFDTAGRLYTAVVPGHTLQYRYEKDNSCGFAKAGMNGNRTLATDTPTGAGSLKYSQRYCYDKADRLLTETETITGATSSNATLTRPAKSLGSGAITYDAHGNVTTLGDQTFTYDESDRHVTTSVVGGPTVTYVRDVSGNIVSRKEVSDGITTVIRYSGDLVLDGSNNVLQRTLALPGGVTVTIPTDSAARTWSYPNLHGDNSWTANASGTRTGLYLYDPFGQAMDVTTKVIGSSISNQAAPDTMPSNYDFAWNGSKGKGYEHAGTIAVVEIGVRMYSSWLGRFLAADPVEGGNTGRYNYPNDPINLFDLDGRKQDCGACSYDHSMAGRAVGNSGEARSIQNSGHTYDSGYNAGATAAFAVHRWARTYDGVRLRTMLGAMAGVAGGLTSILIQKDAPTWAIATAFTASYVLTIGSISLTCAAEPYSAECGLGQMSLLSPGGAVMGKHGGSPFRTVIAIQEVASIFRSF